MSAKISNLSEIYPLVSNEEKIAEGVLGLIGRFDLKSFAPNQYIMELKIKKSKELLTKSQQPVKEIAYAVGFDNLDYFCTFFKNKTNYSPREYRCFTQGETID